MPTMLNIMRAIRGSDLPPTDRHILMTLASLADPETGIIPDRFQPSFSDLAQQTGLGRSTVGRRLPFIEAAGWIKRSAPTLEAAWKDKEKNSYSLLIPPAFVPQQRVPDDEPTSPRPGLVPEGDQSRGQSHSGTSPTAGLVLVPERDRTSPTVGLEVPGPRTNTNQPSPTERGHAQMTLEVAIADPATTDATEVDESRPSRNKRMSRVITAKAQPLPDDWFVSDEMVKWARKETPNVGRFATDKFLDHFSGAPGKDGLKKDWDATWRNWMRRDQEKFEHQRAQGGKHNGGGYPGRPSTRHTVHNSRSDEHDYKEKL